MTEIYDKSKLLLNLIQSELPLIERPYAALGQKIGISEEEAVVWLGEAKRVKLLRQISAIFDTRSLGYQSSLVAAKAPEGKLDWVAEAINRHPGVSHNYARRHPFNLWFTIAMPGTSSLQNTLEILKKESGAESIWPLPTLKLFKIGVKLDMTDGKAKEMGLEEETPLYTEEDRQREKRPLTDEDIRYVRVLQEDLPLRPDPFTPLAEKLGTTPERVLAWCKEFQQSGRIRRIAGIMNHRHAGFRANGMGVWKVPAERIDEVGGLFAQQPEITHCYLRPTYPDWPYNIFTMIHSKKVSSCDAFVEELAQKSGVSEHAVLYSYKEYKKIRLMYFTGEIEAWEKEHGM